VRISQLDVDVERSVILEEMRVKMNAAARAKDQFWTQALPVVAMRTPIGTRQFVSSASSAQLASFYARHYTPANLSVVAVAEGSSELGLAGLQAQVCRAFATSPLGFVAAASKRNQVPYSFADLAEAKAPTRFVSIADADLGSRSISIELLTPSSTSSSTDYVRRDLTRRVLSSCVDLRFKRLAKRFPDLILNAGVSFAILLQEPVVEFSSVRAEYVSQHAEQALQVVLAELLSMQHAGFSQHEVLRAREAWAKFYESRGELSGLGVADELVEFFCLKEDLPLLGPEQERALALDLLSGPASTGIQVAEVNAFCTHDWLRALHAECPVASGLCVVVAQGPTEQNMSGLSAAFARALQAPSPVHQPSHAWQEPAAASSLDAHDLADVCTRILARVPARAPQLGGRMVRETLPRSGASLYYLEAGARRSGLRVCVRPSSSPARPVVSMQGFTLGGASELGEHAGQAQVLDAALSLVSEALRESGVGALSGADVEWLEHKLGVRMHLQRHLLHRGVGGSCPADSFPVLLALLVARLREAPRVQPEVLARLVTRQRHSAPGQTQGVDAAVAKLVREYCFGLDEPLLQPLGEAVWAQVSLDAVERAARQAFANGDAWTLCFVGSVPPGEAWVEELLESLAGDEAAALPPWMRGVAPRALNMSAAGLGKPRRVTVGSEPSDKVNVFVVLAAAVDPAKDVAGVLRLEACAGVLRTRLLQRMRTHDAQDVYNVATDVSRSSLSAHARVFVSFAAAPDKASRLIAVAREEIALLARDGPAPAELLSVGSALRLARQKGLGQDNFALFWLLDAFKAVAMAAPPLSGPALDAGARVQDLHAPGLGARVDELAMPDWDAMVRDALEAVPDVLREMLRQHGIGVLELHPPPSVSM
jgi:predicted Zn-dependent peptidase